MKVVSTARRREALRNEEQADQRSRATGRRIFIIHLATPHMRILQENDPEDRKVLETVCVPCTIAFIDDVAD